MYSDLGFILLGFIAADRGGAPLAQLFHRIRSGINEPDPLTFDLTADQRDLAAPTRPLGDDPRRGRVLVGDVHDHYAFALGGVAGHAGLFGTAPSVGAFARAVLHNGLSAFGRLVLLSLPFFLVLSLAFGYCIFRLSSSRKDTDADLHESAV